MNPSTITCPQCGHSFELSDALTHQLREHLRTELQAGITKREADANRKLAEIKSREQALTDEVEKRLKAGLAAAETKADQKAQEKVAAELKELQDSLREKDASLKDFRANELELRKQKHATDGQCSRQNRYD